MNDLPSPGGGHAEQQHDDAVCWLVAKQLRNDYPAWVVIWAASKHQYYAYPLFRTRRDTTVTAATPAGLATQMNEIQRAARAPRALPPRT